jgi:hypothetical protein
LLTARTIEDAARIAGVGPSTLRRWLAQQTFRAAYRDARRAVLEHTIVRAQSASARALDTLERNLAADAPPAAQIAAARAVLDVAHRGGLLEDLAERVTEIERRGAS